MYYHCINKFVFRPLKVITGGWVSTTLELHFSPYQTAYTVELQAHFMISIQQTLVRFVFKHHIHDIVQLNDYNYNLIVSIVTRPQASKKRNAKL